MSDDRSNDEIADHLVISPHAVKTHVNRAMVKLEAYLPPNAGASLTSLVPASERLAEGAGAAVLAAWVVVLLGAAAVLLRLRDA